MQRHRAPYPPEFRQQIMELVRAGRTPEELSREFEPRAQAIHNWVKQADLDEGRRPGQSKRNPDKLPSKPLIDRAICRPSSSTMSGSAALNRQYNRQ